MAREYTLDVPEIYVDESPGAVFTSEPGYRRGRPAWTEIVSLPRLIIRASLTALMGRSSIFVANLPQIQASISLELVLYVAVLLR